LHKYILNRRASITRENNDNVCPVERAEKRFIAHAKSLENNIQVCIDICVAFKSVLSKEDKQNFSLCKSIKN
jgi:hypothetical protein